MDVMAAGCVPAAGVDLDTHIDESGTQTSTRAVRRASSAVVLAGSVALTAMRRHRTPVMDRATLSTAGATSGAAATRSVLAVGHPPDSVAGLRLSAAALTETMPSNAATAVTTATARL